jgi:DNA-binding protein HU-beta
MVADVAGALGRFWTEYANATKEVLVNGAGKLFDIARTCSANPRRNNNSMTTKAELIDTVAKNAGVTKADAERTLGAFFDTVVATTKKGDKVAWPGFGSFSTTKRSARTGRNPQTGEPVKVPASTALKFTASATLKAALNPKKKKK